MSASKVTSRLNKHFWPPLVEDGFVKFQSREYDRLRDATVNAVRIQPIANSWVGYQHVAEGSFLVQLGVRHMPPQALANRGPENPPDLGVCDIRCDVTTPPTVSDPDPEIWDLARFDSVDAVIETLLEEFERQGLQFFGTWNDPVLALSELDRMPRHADVDPPSPGLPYVYCSGEPDSTGRLMSLATLAAMMGESAKEASYLREAIRISGGGSEAQRRRLKEIEGESAG